MSPSTPTDDPHRTGRDPDGAADELTGRVVVVTGGSRGLGREMVRAFAARGAHVVVASRQLEPCEALATEVATAHGVRALPVAFHAGRWSDCDALVDATYGEFGRVDVLVNNAGMSPLYPSLDQVGEDLFDKVIGVNLRGPFRLTAMVGTRMAADRGGSIINIGSIEAARPQPTALPYAAAKAGLHTLTVGFAQAFAPTVRVNTIQAGPFLTDVARNWPSGVREELEAGVALGRCGRPEEVVGAALFLATSASSFCTGSALCIDGGWI